MTHGLLACGLVSCIAPFEPSKSGEVLPVWYVDDGVHNAVVLSVDDAPYLPHLTDPSADPNAIRYVEYGFSDRRWVLGEDRSLGHVWSLLVNQGEGVVVVRVHPHVESVRAQRFFAELQAKRDHLLAFRAELTSWVKPSSRGWILPSESTMYVVSSTRPYTVKANCREFTDLLLARLGLPEARQILVGDG